MSGECENCARLQEELNNMAAEAFDAFRNEAMVRRELDSFKSQVIAQQVEQLKYLAAASSPESEDEVIRDG